MSNVYCTTDQMLALYDRRQVLQLSGDDNSSQGNTANLQMLLDMQASELDSHLFGRVGLPIVSPPLILTKWVAATTAERLYARRNDRPKQIDADAKWAKDWIELFAKGMVQIPNVTRAELPAVQDSDRVDGSSQFDRIYGTSPSPTGPTHSGNITVST